MELIFAVVLLIQFLIIYWLVHFRKPPVDNSELKDTLELLGKTKQQLDEMKTQYVLENAAKVVIKEAYQKLQFQAKSSQVRTGFIAESLLPLTQEFPCDPKSLRFLGAPIDYISFDYDKEVITFIEIKTGESQLNDNQRKVKKMVEEGKVKFVVVRLNEDGIKVK